MFNQMPDKKVLSTPPPPPIILWAKSRRAWWRIALEGPISYPANFTSKLYR